ncbi:MAG: HAD-IA family hydrolase [Clostridia bacterium]|nr:HAD-IA family hydrolase [Clostridia bacterium]
MDAYIWDLDGTLFDSYGAIVSSLAEVVRACGAADSPEKILKAVKQESVSGYLRDLSAGCGKSAESLYQMYRSVGHRKDGEITLIPGAAETLDILRDRGAKHFVYTHRGATSRPLLERLGIKACFTEIVTSENGFRPKPSGEGVIYLLEKYGLDRMKTAYVGDRTLDVLCAKDAGVQAILYLPEDSCVEPTGKEDRIIRRLTELTEETSCPGTGS